MPVPILTTKLYLPPLRPNAVRRPRLIERLNAGLRQAQGFARKLTLLSAPAGFGKTTLLSAWIESTGSSMNPEAPRFAWLSLEEADGDPIRFVAYLAAAVQTVAPETGAGLLAALEAPQSSPVEALLAAWLNEIAAISYPFCLVLDDYHVLDAPAADAALAFLIEHLPPQMHLVLASREDPHLPLARLRARGQLVELRAADLLFTTAEAAAFLNDVMGLNLTEEAVVALEGRTEGWAAGLQLAALALQGTPSRPGTAGRAHDIESFTGNHHFVLDYLLTEVLDRQPEPVQRFLLRTSVLERMCAPLCEAVLQDPTVSAQDTLEHLEHANLFSVPLDGERRWYRYHRLFGDLLRQRLSRNDAGINAADCHRRAGQWYADNGYPAEAFHHAVAAGDYDQAAIVAELAWLSTYRSYIQNSLFLNWMRALPDEVIRTRPVLSAGYAWAFLDFGDLAAAEPRLQDAEQWLASPQPGAVAVDESALASLPATLAIARATLSLARGDAPDAIGHARRAQALLPESDLFQAAGATAMLGAAYLLNGDLEASADAMIEGMALVEQAGQPAFAFSGIPVLADIRQTQGRLREATLLFERTLQAALPPGEPVLPGAADMALGLCGLAVERNDLQAAEHLLQQSLALGESAGLPSWGYQLQLSQARLSVISGDLDGALSHLQEAERRFLPSAVPEMRPVAARRARVWIRQGRAEEALTWADDAGLSAEDALIYPREYEHVTLGRALLALGQHRREAAPTQKAAGLFDRLGQAAEAGGRSGSLIEILALKALALQALSRLPQAMAALHQALSLAAPEGFLRVFIDEGEALRRLLDDYGTWRNRPADNRLVDDFAYRLQAALAQAAPPATLQPGLEEPLSARELEVLRLIALGHSNPEIASRLCVAVNTIKGHNQRIFGKIGAKTRTEAVARARELGLL